MVNLSSIQIRKGEIYMKQEAKDVEKVTLPINLSFAGSGDYTCYNCKYMNGGKGSQIYCDYYKGYYDPCYCDHFVSKF